MVFVANHVMFIVHKNGNMHNNRVRWFGQTINLEQVLEVSLSVQEVDRWLENVVGADILELGIILVASPVLIIMEALEYV